MMLIVMVLWNLLRYLWQQEKLCLKTVQCFTSKMALLWYTPILPLVLIKLCCLFSRSSFLSGPPLPASYCPTWLDKLGMWDFQWRRRIDTSCTCQVDHRRSIAVHGSLHSLSGLRYLSLSLSLFSHSAFACRIQFHCSPHHSQTLMLVNKTDRHQKGMWNFLCQAASCMVHSGVAVCNVNLLSILQVMIDQIFPYMFETGFLHLKFYFKLSIQWFNKNLHVFSR